MPASARPVVNSTRCVSLLALLAACAAPAGAPGPAADASTQPAAGSDAGKADRTTAPPPAPDVAIAAADLGVEGAQPAEAGAPPQVPDAGAAAPDASANLPPVVPGSGPMPPATWQEHWFDHTQVLELYEYDEHVAIYFDDDVNRQTTKWLLPFISRVWQYTKKTYGQEVGPDPRLYSIHHQGRYSGGHPSTYFDASHDNRNVSDCGPGPWGETAVDLPSHEIAHVVEGANNGVHGSPGFPLWKDSKWAEFYQYDLYVALGMEREAQRLFTKFSSTTDNFPRAGTRWFRDWFHPLWKDHGGAQVMAKFFQLLAKNFPKRAGGKDYARDLNWGEYIHFSSGAAGKDLKPLATQAFGWPAEWNAQLEKARQDFSTVTY